MMLRRQAEPQAGGTVLVMDIIVTVTVMVTAATVITVIMVITGVMGVTVVMGITAITAITVTTVTTAIVAFKDAEVLSEVPGVMDPTVTPGVLAACQADYLTR